MVCSPPSRSSITRLPVSTPQPSSSLIKSKINLAKFTSFRVGGDAEFYAEPTSLEETQACIEWYVDYREDLPLTILGAGSNLLISDHGLPGFVLNTHRLRYYHAETEGLLIASAGEPIARLAWNAAKRGWSGLEWAVGIPGSVGGSIVMNAGAHQGCVADVLQWVKVLEPDGSITQLEAEALDYRYRTSNLQGGDRLVLEAAFKLETGFEAKEIKRTTNANFKMRKETQPYHLPSCGSVFRNPYPKAAGRLIEELGLKGYRIGGAQVAERHANFILNCGDAKAMDIFQLIQHVQAQVEEHWEILLKPEVKILGDFSYANSPLK
ncbi:UDP-N-acetylmuramate dehydrogenase [[Leptolyngbya] sp. PCC 7376]|uniref:UDP-N-acetylmuramate dehydrogenase n=1 Tax=[Leptolyngbya] sp. PCC 7376 TaxID=111781 RepID=UPI00029EF3D6|nr:UDP-N-acetylmuramate dehydrogenase [[Leptolyngbya] sp. PCC 7376]AFY36579.1 UDP-N-acetylmuramate dehydrogenase [[Leptolyngbya] sp. PCC 7376]